MAARPRRRSVFLPQALLAAWHDQEYHRLRTGPVSLLQMVLFLPVILAPHSPRSDTSPAPCWPPTRRVNGSLRSPFTPPKNTLHHHHHPHRHHHPSLESAGGTGRGYSCGVDGSLRSPSTPPGQPSPFIHPTIIILQTSRARASWRRTRRAPTPRCRLGSAIRPCACIRRPRGSGNDSG